MNKTAMSILALAVGAMLFIGIYHVYEPQNGHVKRDVFTKISRNVQDSDGSGMKGVQKPSPQAMPQVQPAKPKPAISQGDIPDKYQVTPNQWKQGVKFQVLRAVTVGNGKSDFPVNETVDHQFGHYWWYAGTPAEPQFKNLNIYLIAEETDNPPLTEYTFVPQDKFNINGVHQFTTRYDKAKNLVTIYETSGW